MSLKPITLALHAMATRFELVLYGEDPVRLRAAGEEALQEIRRLEGQLSFYHSDSEIRWINTHGAARPVKVEPRLFRLLERCDSLTEATQGAFDITVGPLMRAWRFIGEKGRVPTQAELERAHEITGIQHIEFDREAYTVRFNRSGAEIDLGGYGKGYAVERAIDLLKENGVASALLHGGTSSIYAIGVPPEKSAWRVSLGDPFKSGDKPVTIDLAERGLSVSAIHGKSFVAKGRQYGHVIDPRSGEPVRRTLAAAVSGPSSAECEALSTALLVLGPSWLPTLAERFPAYTGIVVPDDSAAKRETKS